MTLRKRLLKNSRIYLILNIEKRGLDFYLGVAYKAIDCGVDIIQLRWKDSRYDLIDILRLGEKVGIRSKSRNVIFIINDRVDIAEYLDADGVHLGQRDIPIHFARRILGPKKLIGYSTHSLKEASRISKEDVDYLSIGPIFSTPYKSSLNPLGVKILYELVEVIHNKPIFAIGGIDLHNIDDIIRTGVSGIAVIRAIMNAEDIRKKIQDFKKRLG